jgi:UDP-glucose:(heptosyl)LPS alpha-1,3-glucosyltransferase
VSETPDTSSPALRVAFLIDRWDPQRGGAERAMAQLAEHLIARGHRVLAIACEHSAGAPGEHVRVTTSGLTRSSRERKLARNLTAAAREHRADVTIGARHLYEVDLYWPHGGAHAVTQLAHRASNANIPNWWPAHPRHRTFIHFERALLRQGGARKIACVSRLVLDELALEYPECRDRLELVENGIDLVKFSVLERSSTGAALRRELRIDERTPLITFVARNPWIKGFVPLTGALTRLLESGETDWRLLVAGVKFDRAHVGKGKAGEVISAPRTTARENVSAVALASASDLLVIPTYRDTSGLALLEALACGTPVVTTRFAGASTVVSRNGGTVIESPENWVELRDAMASWLTRIRAGDIDRDAIRACVARRDSGTWLAKLEALVVDLAATKNAR